MANLSKMDRTWLCSVLFIDIVDYSSQSTELQMRWKERFNSYVTNAIGDVPENDRVILDTGDGAAICFLGSPEPAMFAALRLWNSFAHEEREQQQGFSARIGVNLGPVKLVPDLNGKLNALGDGINIGQRIMSFAGANQILVSQSFYEVVSRLSDDYQRLFLLKGVERDKHVREHTVYQLLPPGAQQPQQSESRFPQATAIPDPKEEDRRRGTSKLALIRLSVAGVALIAIAVFAWHLLNASRGRDEAAQSPATRSPIPPEVHPTPIPTIKKATKEERRDTSYSSPHVPSAARLPQATADQSHERPTSVP
jgi:class 3 adenylate cyclase